jgi:hypothetical protein
MTAVEVISDVNHAAQDITSTMVHTVGDRVHEEARTTEATEARRKKRLVTRPLADLRGGRDAASETPLSKRKKGKGKGKGGEGKYGDSDGAAASSGSALADSVPTTPPATPTSGRSGRSGRSGKGARSIDGAPDLAHHLRPSEAEEQFYLSPHSDQVSRDVCECLNVCTV